MPRVIALADGRDLEIHEHGAPGGPLIVFHNGTPLSGIVLRSAIRDAESRGARIVGISRAGYGRSTRRPGRSVADVADDVAAVLDELGVERCVTWGVSGGGPHALACGARLVDRVAAVGLVASVAPYGVDGLDYMAGMGTDNLEEFAAALAGEAALREWMAPHAEGLATVAADELAVGLASLLSDADRGVLGGEYAEDLAAGARDAVSSGMDGWVDDDLAFFGEWGFAPEEVRVPVTLWQGDHDLMVPPAHGAWLAAHIPGADTHLSPDDGHLTLTARHVPEIHAWLLDRL